MDGGDAYKNLLATASRAQQQRHAQLQTGDKGHAVGNMFLPAIQTRTLVHSALSMKHLQVIEQCILAENRREEQLAKAPSEKERRFLTKKFIAQRHHERDLIHALMLGQPSDEELQIKDVASNGDGYKSPLLAAGTTQAVAVAVADTGGAHSPSVRNKASALLSSPDKVIKMAGEKTSATTKSPIHKPRQSPTKAFASHTLASPERRRFQADKDARLPECGSPTVSPSKAAAAIGDKRVRPTQSASSSPTKHPKDVKLPHALAHSPLKPSIRKPNVTLPSDQKPKPAIRKPNATSPSDQKPKPAKAVVPSSTGTTSPTKKKRTVKEICSEEPVGSIEFEGLTSFQDARLHAMAIVHEKQGLVEGETQTTERLLWSGDTREVKDGNTHTLRLCMPVEDNDPQHCNVLRRRSHSSPEPRRRRASADAAHAFALPSLAMCRSDSTLQEPVKISDDRSGKIHMRPQEALPPQQQVAWRDPDEEVAEVSEREEKIQEMIAADRTVREDDAEDKHGEEQEKELSWDELERLAREEDAERAAVALAWDSPVEMTTLADPPTAVEAAETDCDAHVDAEEHDVAGDDDRDEDGSIPQQQNDEQTSEEDEQDPHSVLLCVLYDLIQHIEDAEIEEELNGSSFSSANNASEESVVIASEPETRRTQLVNFALFVTQIQSAFRGHRARKAFRLALYQEALQCGVLGAMPGTTQGRSGWYQDPKSFMAYYFVVQDDGEWTQKSVLRCTGLILTPYHMQEQIFTRVQAGQ